MKQKILLSVLLLSFNGAFAQEDIDVAPGVDRWEVKTNVTSTAAPKRVKLGKLLALPLLGKEFSDKNYPDKLIPAKVGGTLHEGDMITTTGYLHLVALEKAAGKKDGDYHIQLTLSPDWGDSCFIVEIPYAQFVGSSIKDDCEATRAFIREKLTNNKEPKTSGSVMADPVYVRVTGQLFYDAIHANGMRNPDPAKRSYRGKKGGQPTPMHSYTAWELHPVTHIEFAAAP